MADEIEAEDESQDDHQGQDAEAQEAPSVHVGARRLVWFSAGAASAVAAKLTITDHADDTEIVYIDVGSEHEDNVRFLAECETWFGHPIRRERSTKYRDTWQLWTERRYLVGPDGALCTAELKKKVRNRVQRPDDVQVFGYTADLRDMKRARQFREQNPGIDLATPLIDAGLTHADCLGLIERTGIALPAMYLLGYENNNCIGCVKGGIGYWNKIRRNFPDVYARMADLERDIGASVLREDSRTFTGDDLSIWLDQLDPERGNYRTEPDVECSLMCAIAEERIR